MNSYSHIDSPMSPQSFLGVISRRWKLIVGAFALIVSTVVGVTFVLPPSYEASAKVLVNYQDDYELQANPSTYRAHYDLIGTELSILQIRSIIEPIVDQLHLDESASEASVNPQLQREKAIAHVRSNLQVEREQDTNVLLISYSDGNPYIATQVVNGVVEQYIKQRPQLSKDERASEFFDQQIADIRQRIDSLQFSSQQYKELEHILVPDQQSPILFASLAEYDAELTRVRSERIAKESRLTVLRQQIQRGGDISVADTEASASLSKMDYLNQLRASLHQLKLKRNALKLKYTDKHPDVQTVDQDIRNTQSEINSELNKIMRAEETDVRAARAQEEELTRSMKHVTNSIAELSRKEYELDKRSIGIKDLREVYSMLLRQREEARIAANKKEYLVHARLLEPAMVPIAPSKPNKKLYLALGLMLGCVVSFGLAFFVEYFDHSVYTAEDAMHSTGLPILAVITETEPHQLEAGSQKHSNTYTKQFFQLQ